MGKGMISSEIDDIMVDVSDLLTFKHQIKQTYYLTFIDDIGCIALTVNGEMIEAKQWKHITDDIHEVLTEKYSAYILDSEMIINNLFNIYINDKKQIRLNKIDKIINLI